MEQKHSLQQFIREVLADGFVMNLGVADEQGPWVSSLVYVHDADLNLYWISPPSTRHSKAIEKNPHVACTIVAEHQTDKERALQIQGSVSLAEPSLKRAQQLQQKRGMSLPDSAEKILKKGCVWYKLVPTNIELIYNEHFGYERKSYTL